MKKSVSIAVLFLLVLSGLEAGAIYTIYNGTTQNFSCNIEVSPQINFEAAHDRHVIPYRELTLKR